MELTKLEEWTLEQKEEKSRNILIQAVEKYGKDRIATTFTGGKDSTVVLHLLRQVFDGRVPIPVINIDTSVKFEEIYEFRDRISREWNLNLLILKNDDALKTLEVAADRAECCQKLKTEVLNRAIEDCRLDAVITAIRWDEQEARQEETYFAHKDNPAHTRVNPLLHFKEKDIWDYIRKYDIPYCPLYDKGYRSLGCMPCTQLLTGEGRERDGRSPEKEEIMKKLRSLGYF